MPGLYTGKDQDGNEYYATDPEGNNPISEKQAIALADEVKI